MGRLILAKHFTFQSSRVKRILSTSLRTASGFEVTRLLRALRVPSLMKYVAPLQTLVAASSYDQLMWTLGMA